MLVLTCQISSKCLPGLPADERTSMSLVGMLRVGEQVAMSDRHRTASSCSGGDFWLEDPSAEQNSIWRTSLPLITTTYSTDCALQQVHWLCGGKRQMQ